MVTSPAIPLSLRHTAFTAREIFDELIKGNTILLPSDLYTFEELDNLQNYLTTIKSRDKKVYTELGFDFPSSIVCIDLNEGKQEVRIYLKPSPEKKKYSVFKILQGTPRNG